MILIGEKLLAQNADERLQKDWAYIKKYEKADSTLQVATPNLNRIIFMGDSITELWFYSDSLFFTSHGYVNRGISGQTTGQMLVRFREDVINLKPAMVVILAGINDIAENNGPSKLEDVMGNISSMAELAKMNCIKVVLCSVLPADHFVWRPTIAPAQKVLALNNMIQAYAKEHRLVYLDYYKAMADNKGGLPENLAKDGVHPTQQGYQIMEPLAVAAIHKAL